MRKWRTLIVVAICTICIAVALWLANYFINKIKNSTPDKRGGFDMVIKNYGRQIDSCAAIFNLPANYLKSLCFLECNGVKTIDERFEKHVYKKLLLVKSGELKNYEHVTPQMLEDANDEALRNLASSWGPFQLMGYKCLLLDIKIKDIRGENAIFYGTKWINLTYGNYLRNKRFKDAFHIHNAGSPFPASGIARTHDPRYCQRGLKYMQKFK